MNTNLYIKTAWTDFYGWSKLEYLWLFICSASIALVSIIMGGGMVEFISSVTGIIGAILVAKEAFQLLLGLCGDSVVRIHLLHVQTVR